MDNSVIAKRLETSSRFENTMATLAKREGLFPITHIKQGDCLHQDAANMPSAVYLETVYGHLFYYRETLTCLKVGVMFGFGKVRDRFMVEVASHYEGIFREKFLPTIRAKYSRKQILVFSNQGSILYRSPSFKAPG
jgi:hypothetical protein